MVKPRPGPSQRLRFLLAPLEVIAATLIVALIGLVLVAVVSRYVLSSPITSADEIASFLFLWIVMFGGVIAIDRNEHLRLALVLNALAPQTRSLVETTGYIIVAAFLGSLLPSALEHLYDEIPVSSSIPFSVICGTRRA